VSATTASFLIAILVVLGIVALLWRVVTLRSSGSAKFTVSKLFSAEIVLGAKDIDKATQAVAAARSKRGSTPSAGAEEQIRSAKVGRLTRVLWVDDHPDNNVLETIALEQLGFFVTHATTTQAALEYLHQLDYHIAVTDLARADSPDAGIQFLESALSRFAQLPVIVYTADANAHRDAIMSIGAFSVVDRPDDLIVALLNARNRL
jgi:CheY-like chemotaxis protein